MKWLARDESAISHFCQFGMFAVIVSTRCSLDSMLS